MSDYCGNPGRGSHYMAVKSATKLYECRTEAAEMFGAVDPENIIFTLNTTYALNIAIKSAAVRGAHILFGSVEHNSVSRPVYALAKRGHVSFDIFDSSGNEDEILLSIKKKIRSDTKILVCAHASNVVNHLMPISAIGKLCRERGIYFIVDAAQSAGVYDIDMTDMNIGALCIPGHKGLYGPQGSAMLILNRSENLTTVFEGGSGINSMDTDMPQFLPERFEAGTMATPAIAGLLEGMRYVRNRGLAEIREHEEHLWKSLNERLKNDSTITVYGTGLPGSIFTFNMQGFAPSTVGAFLDSYGICVRTGIHCAPLTHEMLGTIPDGAVRVSFGAFNREKEVIRLCDALRDLKRENI